MCIHTHTAHTHTHIHKSLQMINIVELPSAVGETALSTFRRLDTFAGHPLDVADPSVLMVKRRSVLRVHQRGCGDRGRLYLVQETRRRYDYVAEPRLWLVYERNRHEEPTVRTRVSRLSTRFDRGNAGNFTTWPTSEQVKTVTRRNSRVSSLGIFSDTSGRRVSVNNAPLVVVVVDIYLEI